MGKNKLDRSQNHSEQQNVLNNNYKSTKIKRQQYEKQWSQNNGSTLPQQDSETVQKNTLTHTGSATSARLIFIRRV